MQSRVRPQNTVSGKNGENAKRGAQQLSETLFDSSTRINK